MDIRAVEMATDEESQKPFLRAQSRPCQPAQFEQGSCCRRRSRFLSRWLVLPWFLAVFFCYTTLYLIQRPAVTVQQPHTITYSTDYVLASPAVQIELVKTRFTNDLRFNASSQTFYNKALEPEEVKYIGAPSPVIDSAWQALLHDRHVAISQEEALQFPEAHRNMIDGDGDGQRLHNYFELSVFHNLNCLNEIRMALDVEYYAQERRALVDRVKLDHCIDQIRQALQCHSDLTPVPVMAAVGGAAGVFIGNGEIHTCRNFAQVREWVADRGKLQKALGD